MVEENQNKSLLKKILNIVLNTIIIILVFVALGRIIFAVTFTGIYVCQSSMYPTLNGAVDETMPGGDYIYINKFDKPQRGDIVVFNDGKTTLIKRVIALSGDSLYIEDGYVYLKKDGEDDFTKLIEDYVNPSYYESEPIRNEFYYFYSPSFSYVIPENSMFCMGDNRAISIDSRTHNGSYSMECLLGVVTNWSLNNKEKITEWYTKKKF